jgi:hypothetical protein|tara:strand:+ start:131 stop:340 length:210 start_codon:yes stop_codon:yes gene_type:complete
MATILNELIHELNAKGKRIEKEIINLDRSSVIPQHYDKAESILKLTNKGIETEEQMKYLSKLRGINEQP